MDIGGSLTKIAYYSTVPVKRSVVYPAENTSEKQEPNGKKIFRLFSITSVTFTGTFNLILTIYKCGK